MTGLGLKLRYELHQLAKQHNVARPIPHIEPLLPFCDDSSVILHGLCTDYDKDLERVVIRRGALHWLDWRKPPLFLRHQPVEIGSVNMLEWRNDGLQVSVTTADPTGKNYGAFSIAFTPRRYVLKNTDSPSFYAEIESGILDEISLTSCPANPRALVHQRMPGSLNGEFFDLMRKRVSLLSQLVQLHTATEQRP